MEMINVIGELSFDVPIAPEELAKLQCSDGWCFGSRRVRLLGLFLARDRKRAVLLFSGTGCGAGAASLPADANSL